MNKSDYYNIRYACFGQNGNFLPPFPIDPVKLTEVTLKIVSKKNSNTYFRKYTKFYAVSVYGGIATAYSVGCNFRCVFCWVDWSRDWPEKYGKFYSAKEVYNEIKEIMKVKHLRRARISGAEPTLCPEHLFEVLDFVYNDLNSFDLFIIETNGIVISQDETIVQKLKKYADTENKKIIGHVRLSIRGGSPIPFTKKTGCSPEFVNLPFIAAERLWKAGVSFHVAVVVDSRFTSQEEKKIIYERLYKIDPSICDSVEEEYLDPYPHALVRLRAVGREDITGKAIGSKEKSVLLNMPF